MCSGGWAGGQGDQLAALAGHVVAQRRCVLRGAGGPAGSTGRPCGGTAQVCSGGWAGGQGDRLAALAGHVVAQRRCVLGGGQGSRAGEIGWVYQSLHHVGLVRHPT